MRRVAAVLLIALLASSLFAQRYNFHNYAQSDGLSNLSVTCLGQDRQGYLWAGTQDGLFRYDGKRFQQISGAEGLLDTWIQAVVQAPDGALWVASDRGVARWDGSRFAIVSKGNVRALAWDDAGKPLTAQAGGAMESLHVDTRGQLWFTRGAQVFTRVREEAQPVAGAPQETWSAILSDPGGNLWLRGDTSIYVRASGQSSFRRMPGNYPSADHRSATLVLNEKNNVLAPTARGLAVLNADSGLVRLLTRKTAGLLSDSISAFLRDREGSAWVGYLGSGVGMWEGYGEWSFWNSDDGLASDSVWAVRKDRRGYWFATNAGLSRMAEGTGRFDSWMRDSRILSFGIDDAGTIWAASTDGLRALDAATGVVRHLGPEEGLAHVFTGAVIVQRNTVWVGTSRGLFAGTRQSGGWHFEAAGLEGLTVNCLLFRRNGDLVACTSQGLWVRSGEDWKRFSVSDGLRTDEVLTAAEAPDGAIWIAYERDVGLSRLTLQGTHLETKHFGQEEFRAISFLGADESGRIWVGSQAGVDALQNGRWMHYRREDGLVWNDVCENSFFADPDGSVWIGTAQGVSRFYPSARATPRNLNTARVEQIRVGERLLAPEVRNQLRYRDRTLTIDFTALIFKNPEAVRFRYRLSGLEDSWTETAQRSARYTNLPAGEYVFEVKSRGESDLGNSSETWDLEPARTTFVIATPWYQSWYFAVVFTASLLYGARWFWRWRVTAMLARQSELERAVRERTEALEELAIRDALTGLHNRGAIFALLERELENSRITGRALAVIMADLDYFKSVNDRFGHQVGDGVLMECSTRLRSTVRATDLIGRYGGEELLIVLLNCSERDALRIAEDMRQAICSTPFTVLDRTFPVSCSFGVASVGKERIDMQELVRKADRALYVAKRGGRNRVQFWDQMVDVAPAIST